MFGLWIGGRPPAKELECMSANEDRHGLTLIASENWVGARRFVPLDTVVFSALQDARVRRLWYAPAWPGYGQEVHRADALRLWYLMRHPWEVYADSDCIIHGLPADIARPLCPSIQANVEALAGRFGGVPDMDDIRNASGEWLDVWAIVGAGDPAFFDAWLSLWVQDFFRPGGIAEALSHGPFEVGVLPDSCYSHFSTRKTEWSKSPC
jgi:hypothetical protein